MGPENARVLDAVVSVLGSIPTDLSQRIVAIGAETEDTIRMTLGDGTVLVWGGVEQAALKAEVALALLESGIGRRRGNRRERTHAFRSRTTSGGGNGRDTRGDHGVRAGPALP